MHRLKIQTSKSRALANSRRDTMRRMLLGYALRLGATEEATQRLLAARLWRLLPRDTSHHSTILRLAILRLDCQVALWASAVLQRPVTVSQLATAIMDSRLTPDFLLQPVDRIDRDVLRSLDAALIPVAPPETPTEMPVQSLIPLYAARGTAPHTLAATL